MYSKSVVILAALAAVIATALVIYFTPLKWINFIEPTIKDIAPAEFYEDFSANPNDYIFLDVRPESSYNAVHAQGSVSMPLHTLYNERRSLPKSGKTIVLICSGGVASGVGYHYLEHHGFFNILRIENGIEQWILDELPVEGSQVFSNATQ